MWSGGVSRTTEQSGGGRQANRHTTCSKHTYLSFLKWTIRLLDVRGLRQRQSHEEPVRPTWYPIAVELSKLVLLGLDSGTRAQIWSSFQYTILSQKQQFDPSETQRSDITSPESCDSRAEQILLGLFMFDYGPGDQNSGFEYRPIPCVFSIRTSSLRKHLRLRADQW